jgi:hypothetical protein
MSLKVQTFNFLVQELQKLRTEVTDLEVKISEIEGKFGFRGDEPRYLRLLEEKKILLSNTCEIRLVLGKFSDSESYSVSNDEKPPVKRKSNYGNNHFLN